MTANKVYVYGSYIDIHDNEVVNLSVDKGEVHLGNCQPKPTKPEESIVPEVLAGSELWQKVKQAGLVDTDGQPTVSRPEAALLADMLARRLGIANKWKFF